METKSFQQIYTPCAVMYAIIVNGISVIALARGDANNISPIVWPNLHIPLLPRARFACVPLVNRQAKRGQFISAARCSGLNILKAALPCHPLEQDGD
jgi:hypothetical protein